MQERSAGILLSITSLPSSFGIGDLGPEAFAFVDFLANCNQRYWQLLPLNPVEASQGFSPYSSISSHAGNPLLISPEAMVSDGFLPAGSLRLLRSPNRGRVDYRKVATEKTRMIERSFSDAKQSGEFTTFCSQQASWLDDFALYSTIKQVYGGKPWYSWPLDLRNRSPNALERFSASNTERIEKIKWSQFIFFRQWAQLKKYCERQGIRLLGDLPFYVSHDSVDTWANRSIFKLKANGMMAEIAGVPPDYFNAEGQLWGMPVFRWSALAQTGYKWWIERIRRNLEVFDDLRLDHFRAFSTFWEVPPGQTTAINGRWRNGPGDALFDALKRTIGLPFIAEDLGDIGPEVHRLRDKYALPGMKVLQFAFGKKGPNADHVPYCYERNFVVYTGTHDNNTTRGWWMQDADREIRQLWQEYAGQAITQRNVHLVLARTAYASVANLVIIPMQDMLGLDASARMNIPATSNGNWSWRMKQRIPPRIERILRSWTEIYGRRNTG